MFIFKNNDAKHVIKILKRVQSCFDDFDYNLKIIFT